MPETFESIILELEARDKASKPLDDVRKQSDALVKTARALRIEANKLLNVFDAEEKVLKSSNRAVTAAVKAEEQLAKAKKNTTTATQDSIKAQREAAENARRFGDVESRGTAILGAVGFIGGSAGQQIERTGRIGTELLAATEGVGLLKQELPQLASNLVASAGGATAAAVSIGAVGAALIAVVAVYKVFQAQVEASKEATEQLINVNQRYAEVVANSTSEEVEKAIKANEDRNAVLELERERLQQFVESVNDIDGVSGALLDLNDALGLNLGGIEDVKNRLNDVNSELRDNTDLNRQLAAAIRNGATATEDAALLEAEIIAERERLSNKRIAAIMGQLELERTADERARTFSETQRQNRLAAIEDSLAYEKQLRSEIDTKVERGTVDNAIAADYLTASYAREDQLTKERDLLETVVKAGVEANEELADAEKRAADAAKQLAKNVDLARKVYESAAASSAKLADDLADVEQKRLDAEQDYADKTLEIAQDRDLKLVQEAEKFALQRVNDLADHYKDLADLDQQFYEERGELLEDLQSDLNDLDIGLGDDLAALKDDLKDDLTDLTQDRLDALKDYNTTAQRASEDHYRRLQDIQRRAQNDIRSASARLDALGIYEAQKAAEEQLQVENDQYTIEQRRREEDFRDQLQALARERRERLAAYREAQQDLRKRYQRERTERIQAYQRDLQDLNRSHQQERQAQIAAFNEKIRREDQQRALERQQQQQSWALEDAQRAAQYQKQRDELNQHYSLMLTLTADGLYQVELAYQAWLDSMATRTAPGVIASGASAPGGAVPTFARGGYPPVGRNVIVGERGPELVRFMQPARVYGTGQRPGGLDGATININIDGSRSPMQTAYVTRRELESLLRRSR